MSNRHEDVLGGVEALARDAFGQAKFTRGGSKPTRADPAGNVVMRDGDPGEPEVLMSPRTWIYTRPISLEIAPYLGGDAQETVARMLVPLRDAINQNPTLSGLCDWIEPVAPVPDEADVAGAETLTWFTVDLLVTYATNNPLG
jgi:hypothetical protein